MGRREAAVCSAMRSRASELERLTNGPAPARLFIWDVCGTVACWSIGCQVARGMPSLIRNRSVNIWLERRIERNLRNKKNHCHTSKKKKKKKKKIFPPNKKKKKKKKKKS